MDSWLLPVSLAAVGLLAVAVLLAVVFLARARPKPRAAKSPPRPAPAVQQAPAPAPTTASTGLVLIGLTGAFSDRVYPIGPNGLTLGRNPDNDVALGDELMVSRYHAEIMLHDGGLLLRDLESSNGTWVDGQRIVTQSLQPGNRIRIGGVEWLLSEAGKQPARPGAMLEPKPAQSLGAAPIPPVAPEVEMAAPAEPAAVAQAEAGPGAYFDGFWLEQLVGQGGMSRVYKARTPEGQVVALKILQSTDPYLVQKFEAEGREIGPLLQNHPHIVRVHGFHCSSDGHLYLVMDFVDGCSLRKRLGQARPGAPALGRDDIVQILGQTCSALGWAHAANVIHRDVKPENILLGSDGQVKVADFGIARLTSAITVTGTRLVGTPEYMSPEQAKGEPVRAASDVYSLGIVLYEMLTGEVPFPMPGDGTDWRDAMTVVAQHLHTAPVPPHEKAPTVAGDLEQIALKALEKNWQKRFRDAAAMGQALGYHEEARVPSKAGPERRATPAGCRIAVIDGPQAGREWPAGPALILGRADLDPSDNRISRRHLQIEWRGNGFWLQDLSINGTWVNGTRVADSIQLQPGDLISIGASVLQLKM